MSKTIETIVLHRARALLGSEQHWTLGAWARDEHGRPCDPLSSHASRWCAWGALQKCAYDLVGSKQLARRIANSISKHLVPTPGGLPFVNERGGYALVQTVLETGGPPVDAGATWPFIDFHTRDGFGVFARENQLRRLELEQSQGIAATELPNSCGTGRGYKPEADGSVPGWS